MDLDYFFFALVIAAFGAFVGAIIGAGLGKWPAQGRLRNMARGALFGIGAFFTLFLFAVMVSKIFLLDLDKSTSSRKEDTVKRKLRGS